MPTPDAKPLGLREAKKLMAERMRDPNTDAKTFTRLAGIMSRVGGWSRRRRTPSEVEQGLRKRIARLQAENDEWLEEFKKRGLLEWTAT